MAAVLARIGRRSVNPGGSRGRPPVLPESLTLFQVQPGAVAGAAGRPLPVSPSE